MRYIFRGLVLLILLGAAALVVYAYVGDLTPRQEEMSLPVAIGGAG
ncbi:MAG: hypothetical protein IT545_02630 [Rhodobacteraceae bacterium]|nr:hypothetical protein [Paracoccaceae bacterium]